MVELLRIVMDVISHHATRLLCVRACGYCHGSDVGGTVMELIEGFQGGVFT
jgi:hypothetical protein